MDGFLQRYWVSNMAAPPPIPVPQSLRYRTASPGNGPTAPFIAIGMLILGYAAITWHSQDLLKFGGILAVAVCSSGLRLRKLGGVETIRLNFLFVLVAIAELGTPETLLLAAAAGLTERMWAGREDSLRQNLFDVSRLVIAAAVASRVFHSIALVEWTPGIRLLTASFALFLFHTVPAAIVTSRRDGEPFVWIWHSQHVWGLPYYLLATGLAVTMSWANHLLGWQTVLASGPVVYLLIRSYRLYVERVEDERRHSSEVSSLHMRTIEALALAIDAKDQVTQEHLQRVQVYATELGKEFGLSENELAGLRAAALLHDIGKLGVPEHIVSKPGLLTPEEFEKMKIHTVVGAEILDRIQFPYPVVPIVRAHHEKWDGSGYPYGLSGEAIPIGARILSAVDCLDALVTDRQYRGAVPLEEAIKTVEAESGKAYDPRVVALLASKYREYEELARKLDSGSLAKVFGLMPPKAAGVEEADEAQNPAYPRKNPEKDFLSSIAAARSEVQALFEISQDLGNSVSLDEMLSTLGARLRRIVPHHAMAIWFRRENVLVPEYVNGEEHRQLASLRIPIGMGVSGFVAENRKPAVNAHPGHELGYLRDPRKKTALRSALAVPLEGANGVLGVLTIYHTAEEAFSKDHLRILLGITSKVGVSIENAMRFRQAETSATTDFLTTLPNSRSLFLQLDAELARGRREDRPLAVLVLDLDGFKEVNDKLGHLEGNRVLQAVGQALKYACREYDYVARMGGDEFVVLLPGVRQQDVESKVSQFREVVARAGQQCLAESKIGASIGYAISSEDGGDAETLLAEADRRMYDDKRRRKTLLVRPRPFLLRTGTKA